MIGSTRQGTVWASGAPAELRQGFDGLSGRVSDRLGQDPLSGDCSLFVQATRTRATVLLWDGTGLCLDAKRLERGRFACLWRDATARVVRLTRSERQLFLEGSALVGRVALSPASFVLGGAQNTLAAPGRRCCRALVRRLDAIRDPASVASLRRMIKGNLHVEFGRHELTSYSGLELLRRSLRRLDLPRRLRAACTGTGGDSGGGRLALLTCKSQDLI